MAYGGFFLLVFVGAAYLFLQMQSQDLTRAETSYAQQVAYGFADRVEVAQVAGPGFVQTIRMPSDLLGRDYNMTISRSLPGTPASQRETGFVYVEWVASNDRLTSVSAPTVTTKYDFALGGGVGNDSQGFIVIRPGIAVEMENINGTMKISKAT